MKQILTIVQLFCILCGFSFIHFEVNSQVYCTGDTPFFSVDLTGNPAGTWVSPQVSRDGTCCGGAENQVNCIEMSITLDPSAVGINFSVFSGANPGGALYFQINCQDVPVPTSGAPICLSGPGPHYISYCKVGNNQNEYAITSVPGPYTSGDILTAEGCSEQLSVTGVNSASISWNSISPGTSGQYNNLLSNTSETIFGVSGSPFNGFSDVNVTPTLGSPSTVQYQVCGDVVASCLTEPFCDTVTVTIVPELDVTIAPAAPYLCFGQSFETLTATVSGGLAPYTYLWSNGQTTSSINVTSGGTYSVTVSDATGCPLAIEQVTVVQFIQPITANAGSDLTVCQAISSNISINGAVTGTSTGIWTGGSGTYSSSNTDLSLNYTLSASEILAGSVTLTLTTTNTGDCPIASDQMIITVSEMTLTVSSQQNLSCFGGSNGSVILNGTGGLLPYTYSLNGGPSQPSNTFTNLPAGTHNAVVTDAAGCSGNVSFTITAPPQLTFTQVAQNVDCFGTCTGEITVTANGGTLPYTYSSNFGTTFYPSNVLTNLCAGTIGVVVQDANGCITNVNVPITQPTQLTASYVNTNPVCAGACDGSIVVTGAGGTTTYQYSVDGGALQPSGNLSGLCGGNHTILVQDGQGCQITSIQNLVDPPTFGIDLVSMTESSCGFNSGAIEVMANGLNGPFLYSMEGGPQQPTGVYTNLVAGAYSFVATDALGCTAQVFQGINDIEMDGVLLVQTDALCFGGNEGTVQVTNVAGLEPITYELDNSGATQTNGTFTGLFAGSHIVTIYDAGLCIFTIPFITGQPDEIQFVGAITNVTCNAGNNGAINITSTTGGTGAYQYSIDGMTFQSGTSFTGLTAGTYYVYVLDANNCSVVQEFVITQPTPVTIQNNLIHLTCYNNSTGVIQLDGFGGMGGYQYSINNGTTFQPSQTFFGLSAGNYIAVVSDLAGCQATANLVITEPAPLVGNYLTTPVTCFGDCNGIIQVTANGGTAPYLYSSNNGVTMVTSPTLSGLCAGSYQVQVIDDNGCGVLSNVNITTPTELTISTNVVPSTCGLPNGEISGVAAGGIPLYTYSLDNVTYGPASTFTGLTQGLYTIYVRDDNDCEAQSSSVINNLASPVITGSSFADVSCFNGCDGQIQLFSIGGTGISQYSIGGAFQLSNVFTNLCPGTYTTSIMDENNCVTNGPVQIEINEPDQLILNSILSNLTCFENGTGVVNFQIQGGTPSYQYSIDGGSTFSANNLFTLLDAGIYDLYVQDAQNCLAIGQAIISQPSPLEITSINITNATCNASCDGTAQVVAQGGTSSGDYEYNWFVVPNIINNSQITGLCQGNYTSVVLDDNGCYDTISFTISEPEPISIDSLTAFNPLCQNSCNGSITIWSSNASSYSFDGGQTFISANSISTLCEGNYTVIAQNSLGCSATIEEIIISDPPLLTVTACPDSIICLGNSAILYADAFGGTQPYTFYWNDLLNTHTQIVVPIGDSTFNVYVEDANGCVSNLDSMLLSVYESLIVSISNDTLICPNSPINLSVQVETGVPTFNYLWSANGLPVGVGSNINVNPSLNTSYTVSVDDLCSTIIDTVNVTVISIPEVSINILNDEACAPMDVVIYPTINGTNTMSNCVWNFSDGTVINGCDTIYAQFTNPGCYDVTFSSVLDNGCPITNSSTDVFCVIENPQASFYFYPFNPTYISPEVSFTNTSVFADNYAWTFTNYSSSTETDPYVIFSNAQPNEIIMACLTATNYLGCSDIVCKPIIIEDVFTIYVPNSFTPDGDKYNQIFIPRFLDGWDIKNYEFKIYNRWGEQVFVSTDPYFGWNGEYSNNIAPDGVYTWTIQLKDGKTNKFHELVGHVSILR